MNLSFEIQNSLLERKDTNVPIDKKEIICNFLFKTPEWKGIEKYIVFWDENNKSTIVSIGKRKMGECKVPQHILNKSTFQIQVYANENLFTQKLEVTTIPYNNIIPKEKQKNQCDKKKQIKEEYQSKQLFQRLFLELESKVDSIVYENGYLKCFAGEKIIYSEPIFKNIIDDIENIVRELNNTQIDNVVLNKDKVICYSEGEVFYDIPFSSSSLSEIAWTGDYNDLKNKPTEFNPAHHTHKVIDVVDYEENVGADLNILLDFLSDEINKE